MQGTLQIPAAGSPRIAPLFFNFKVASPDTGTDVCPVNLAPAARLDPKASRSEGSKARAVGWIASNLPVQKYQLYIQIVLAYFLFSTYLSVHVYKTWAGTILRVPTNLYGVWQIWKPQSLDPKHSPGKLQYSEYTAAGNQSGYKTALLVFRIIGK